MLSSLLVYLVLLYHIKPNLSIVAVYSSVGVATAWFEELG